MASKKEPNYKLKQAISHIQALCKLAEDLYDQQAMTDDSQRHVLRNARAWLKGPSLPFVPPKKVFPKSKKEKELRALLEELRDGKHRFREPNSDYYACCTGCGRSPYNVPPHDEDCIVPRIREALAL